VSDALIAGVVARARDIVYRYRLRPDRAFEYVSPSVTELTGYTPAEHYADPELGVKVVHPDDREQLQLLMTDIRDGGPVRLRWIRRDGGVLWTEHRMVAICDEAGRMVAIEGIAREVAPPAGDGQLAAGDLVVDLEGQRAVVGGRPVHLTPVELRILALLALRGRPVARAEIVREVWRTRHVAGRLCDAHISHLRRKIERRPRFPERLVTVRDYGYELRAP